MSQEIYITTAIPYVNGAPHIGHAEDYLLADIYARYQTMQGKNVRFQAGTDEHGNKIEKKAGEQQIDIKTYVDQNSAKFQDFLSKFDIKYTDFIRTTDPSHIERVQKIWQRLEKHIYSSNYDGWYCEGCERFVTQKEHDENHGTCPDHQTPYQHLTESNYYFRVSDFKDEIRAAIESGKMQILPEFRKNEVLRMLEDAPDVSISRPVAHLKWGIPVPGDTSQVMYVWMDALTNYITVLGYPDQDISTYWPATVQVVGKDILRFHAILWPAILLGLGLPLPQTILSHGFIQVDGQKISKSLGNGIDPVEVLEKHGINAFRYFFSKHIDTFLDADFTWEKFENAYRNELANDYGNLVQRLSVLCQKNSVEKLDFSPAFIPEYTELMEKFEFTNAINKAWGMIQDVNRHIEEHKPWQLAKTAPEQARVSLSGLVKELLIANHHLKPFLPITETVESIFTGTGQILPPEVPLFPKD
jgi:methionine--tRNA ligase